MNTFKTLFKTTVSIALLASCNPQETNPTKVIDDLVKEYGYIGFQNPLSDSGTGTLVAGRPSAVAFVAHSSDCFDHEALPRHFDTSDIKRVETYSYQGNLGFLTTGTPLISAGLGITKDIKVEIVLDGIIMEYMSSIDVTEHYLDSMSNTCKQYLNDVGFIIQGLKANKMKISLKKMSGISIGLNSENISQYFKFETGIEWSMVDEYHVEITTPKYIGYQLGRLRLEDQGRTLYRAMSIKDDKYIFEQIGLFNDDESVTKSLSSSVLKSNLKTDNNAIYR
jgi:hypothetical protein